MTSTNLSSLELKLLAKQKKVKGYFLMNKSKLCKILGIENPKRKTVVERPTRKTRTVILSKTLKSNDDDDDVLKFTSAYKASKSLDVNIGILYYYNKNQKMITVGENSYFVQIL